MYIFALIWTHFILIRRLVTPHSAMQCLRWVFSAAVWMQLQLSQINKTIIFHTKWSIFKGSTHSFWSLPSHTLPAGISMMWKMCWILMHVSPVEGCWNILFIDEMQVTVTEQYYETQLLEHLFPNKRTLTACFYCSLKQCFSMTSAVKLFSTCSSRQYEWLFCLSKNHFIEILFFSLWMLWIWWLFLSPFV